MRTYSAFESTEKGAERRLGSASFKIIKKTIKFVLTTGKVFDNIIERLQGTAKS